MFNRDIDKLMNDAKSFKEKVYRLGKQGMFIGNGLNVLGGNSGTGKTNIISATIADDLICNVKRIYMFVQLEINKYKIYNNITRCLTGNGINDIKPYIGRVIVAKQNDKEDNFGDLQDYKILLDEQRKFVDEARKMGYDPIIVVDNVQLIFGQSKSQQNETEGRDNYIMALTRDIDYPIILLANYNPNDLNSQMVQAKKDGKVYIHDGQKFGYVTGRLRSQCATVWSLTKLLEFPKDIDKVAYQMVAVKNGLQGREGEGFNFVFDFEDSTFMEEKFMEYYFHDWERKKIWEYSEELISDSVCGRFPLK